MTPERIWIHPADSLQLYVTQEMPDAIGYRRDDQVCLWRPVAPEELPEGGTVLVHPCNGDLPFCAHSRGGSMKRYETWEEFPSSSLSEITVTDAPTGVEVVLASDADRLLEALDDIVTAWELPGHHCELIDAMDAARKLLPEEEKR